MGFASVRFWLHEQRIEMSVSKNRSDFHVCIAFNNWLKSSLHVDAYIKWMWNIFMLRTLCNWLSSKKLCLDVIPNILIFITNLE